MDLDPALHDRLSRVLEGLLGAGPLRAVLLLDRSGGCVAAAGDERAMMAVAHTHFAGHLSLSRLSRDPEGTTLLSEDSASSVRLEAVGKGFILALVGDDPVVGRSMRAALDDAEQELAVLLTVAATV